MLSPLHAAIAACSVSALLRKVVGFLLREIAEQHLEGGKLDLSDSLAPVENAPGGGKVAVDGSQGAAL